MVEIIQNQFKIQEAMIKMTNQSINKSLQGLNPDHNNHKSHKVETDLKEVEEVTNHKVETSPKEVEEEMVLNLEVNHKVETSPKEVEVNHKVETSPKEVEVTKEVKEEITHNLEVNKDQEVKREKKIKTKYQITKVLLKVKQQQNGLYPK